MLDPKQFRDNPKAIAKYLNAAFEKSDLNGILDAIKIVMQAQNVTELAESRDAPGWPLQNFRTQQKGSSAQRARLPVWMLDSW